jgi:hypothetical protein
MSKLSQENIASERLIQQALDKMSVNTERSIFSYIKGSWLSTTLVILYGIMAWSYSQEFLVVFLGIVTVVFAVESESFARRARERNEMKIALLEMMNILRRQLENSQFQEEKKPNKSEQATPRKPSD